MTTGRCSWRKSTRSNSLSGRGLRMREPWRGTRCIGWLRQTVMTDLMLRSHTASRMEMNMENSSSSPRRAWCRPRSSPLQENTTYLQWVSIIAGYLSVLSFRVSQRALRFYNRCLFVALLLCSPHPLKFYLSPRFFSCCFASLCLKLQCSICKRHWMLIGAHTAGFNSS